eukprot:RCo013804
MEADPGAPVGGEAESSPVGRSIFSLLKDSCREAGPSIADPSIVTVGPATQDFGAPSESPPGAPIGMWSAHPQGVRGDAGARPLPLFEGQPHRGAGGMLSRAADDYGGYDYGYGYGYGGDFEGGADPTEYYD